MPREEHPHVERAEPVQRTPPSPRVVAHRSHERRRDREDGVSAEEPALFSLEPGGVVGAVPARIQAPEAPGAERDRLPVLHRANVTERTVRPRLRLPSGRSGLVRIA